MRPASSSITSALNALAYCSLSFKRQMSRGERSYKCARRVRCWFVLFYDAFRSCRSLFGLLFIRLLRQSSSLSLYKYIFLRAVLIFLIFSNERVSLGRRPVYGAVVQLKMNGQTSSEQVTQSDGRCCLDALPANLSSCWAVARARGPSSNWRQSAVNSSQRPAETGGH